MQKNYINILLLAIIIIMLNNCTKNTQEIILAQDPAKISQEPEIPEILDVNQVIKKQTKDMTFDEAKLAKEYYEKEKDQDMVIKTAERIVAIGSDQEVSSQATLDLAKIYLERGSYEKAQKYASDYQIMYPGTEQSKDAAYLEAKAYFLASPDYNRDQTSTKKALEVCKEFEKNYPNDPAYSQEIKNMITASYKKLLDHEIGVIDLYLIKYDYFKNISPLKSAQKRILYIKEKLLPNLPDQEKEIKELETNIENLLAQATKNNVPLIEAKPEKNEDIKPQETNKDKNNNDQTEN